MFHKRRAQADVVKTDGRQLHLGLSWLRDHQDRPFRGKETMRGTKEVSVKLSIASPETAGRANAVPLQLQHGGNSCIIPAMQCGLPSKDTSVSSLASAFTICQCSRLRFWHHLPDCDRASLLTRKELYYAIGSDK